MPRPAGALRSRRWRRGSGRGPWRTRVPRAREPEPGPAAFPGRAPPARAPGPRPGRAPHASSATRRRSGNLCPAPSRVELADAVEEARSGRLRCADSSAISSPSWSSSAAGFAVVSAWRNDSPWRGPLSWADSTPVVLTGLRAPRRGDPSKRHVFCAAHADCPPQARGDCWAGIGRAPPPDCQACRAKLSSRNREDHPACVDDHVLERAGSLSRLSRRAPGAQAAVDACVRFSNSRPKPVIFGASRRAR